MSDMVERVATQACNALAARHPGTMLRVDPYAILHPSTQAAWRSLIREVIWAMREVPMEARDEAIRKMGHSGCLDGWEIVIDEALK